MLISLKMCLILKISCPRFGGVHPEHRRIRIRRHHFFWSHAESQMLVLYPASPSVAGSLRSPAAPEKSVSTVLGLIVKKFLKVHTA